MITHLASKITILQIYAMISLTEKKQKALGDGKYAGFLVFQELQNV